MESKEVSVLEMLFDARSSDPIRLEGKYGTLVAKQVYATVIGKFVYAILAPLTPIEGVAENEALVFRVNKNLCLRLVIDAKKTKKVFDEYYAALEQAREGV